MSCCAKIPHIARLRKTLRSWRKNACRSIIPSDVPAGHVAVHVGPNYTRYIVRAKHLNHPVFMKLLIQAEEEFGFSNSGPLVIPCTETVFEDIIRYLTRSNSTKPGRFHNIDELRRQCNVGVPTNFESRPLLSELFDKSMW